MNIKDIIDKGSCPIINSIIFANGDLYVLDNSSSNIEVLCKSSIDSYFDFNKGMPSSTAACRYSLNAYSGLPATRSSHGS